MTFLLQGACFTASRLNLPQFHVLMLYIRENILALMLILKPKYLLKKSLAFLYLVVKKLSRITTTYLKPVSLQESIYWSPSLSADWDRSGNINILSKKKKKPTKPCICSISRQLKNACKKKPNRWTQLASFTEQKHQWSNNARRQEQTDKLRME